VEPADEPRPTRAQETGLRARAARLQEVARQAASRAEEERRRHASVDALFVAVDRDGEVGGGIMAGALAYRLFIWLLPAALVAVVGLGIVSDASSETPEHAADGVGLGGLVSSSVANAAEGSNRWYALLIGIPLLLWATRSLLRALIVVHRLVWMDVRSMAPKPTPAATLRLLAVLVAYLVASAVVTAIQADSLPAGILASAVDGVVFAAFWLVLILPLPHRGAGWRDLVPGALLFGLGIQALGVVVSYVVAPQASSKQGTYGSLGIAAALLLGLYLVSRLVVATAVLNVTLWERRAGRAAELSGAPPHDRRS